MPPLLNLQALHATWFPLLPCRRQLSLRTKHQPMQHAWLGPRTPFAFHPVVCASRFIRYSRSCQIVPRCSHKSTHPANKHNPAPLRFHTPGSTPAKCVSLDTEASSRESPSQCTPQPPPDPITQFPKPDPQTRPYTIMPTTTTQSTLSSSGQTSSQTSSHQQASDNPIASLGQPNNANPEATTPTSLTSKDLQEIIQASLNMPAGLATLPMPLEEMAKLIGTSTGKGLKNHATTIAHQQEKYGSNKLPAPKSVTFLELVVEALGDFTLIMLLVAGSFSLGLGLWAPGQGGEWVEGAAILGSAAVVVLVGAGSTYQKEQKFRHLSSLKEDVQVRVIRGEKERKISAQELVVGDVLIVEGGDIVPADGLLLPGGSIRMDESHLTGESEDVTKEGDSECGRPAVYSGSKVLEGFGRILVLAVGECSQQGVINALTADVVADSRLDTLLVQKLDKLAHTIGNFGVAAAGLVLVLNLTSQGLSLVDQGLPLWAPASMQGYLRAILNAITVLVVAVPEGLPLAVTLALAFSVQRMLADATLVRNLPACETMAGVTTVLSDKTGTLTENNMRVVRVWAGGNPYKTRPSSTDRKLIIPHTVTASRTSTKTSSITTTSSTVSRTAPSTAGSVAASSTSIATTSVAASAAVRTVSSSSTSTTTSTSQSASPSASPSTSSNGTKAMSDIGTAMASRATTTGTSQSTSNSASSTSSGSSLNSIGTSSSGSLGSADAPNDITLTMVSLSIDEELLRGSAHLPSRTLPTPPPNSGLQQHSILSRSATEALPPELEAVCRLYPPCNVTARERELAEIPLPAAVSDPLLMNIALNSTACVQVGSGSVPLATAGNKTECALLEFAMRLDPALRRLDMLKKEHEIIESLPFSSQRKSMTTVVKARGGRPEQQDMALMLTKGAAEVVLPHCRWQIGADGQLVPLPADVKAQILDSFSREGLRVLAFANTMVPQKDVNQYLEVGLGDMVLVGLVGLQDPLREEVPLAVEQCSRAGITTRMLTGDSIITATSIARQCCILPAEMSIDDALKASAAVKKVNGQVVGLPDSNSPHQALAIEAPRLRTLLSRPGGGIDEAAFLAVWPHLRVVARCTPADKHLLTTGVKMLRHKGLLPDVVAVTGDGTNDAPALRAADVGFAMACGTEIAKEAADILLLDNSFSSVVAAVRWGRNVYSGIAKFLQFQLTANVVAVTTAALGAALIQESPLSATQMLWVNLIMDSLASLALATEPPTDGLLDGPPIAATKPLVTPTMTKHILGQAVLQLGVIGALVLGGDRALGISHEAVGTMVFNSFVLMQLFNQVNCRRVRDESDPLEGLLGSPLFLAILVSELVLQVFIVQFGGRAFSTVPLSPALWAVCTGIGALSLITRAALVRLPLAIKPALVARS